MRGAYFIATLLCAAGGLAVLPDYGEDQSTSAVTQPAAAKDSVVALIRTKLADSALRKGADPADLAALEAVYKSRTGGPLWMKDMGFSAKGERALSEISEADDWGLDASAFDLPSGNDLPAGPEAAAIAELKLDLAILKYARFARGGRLTPLDIDDKLDQAPPLRDPNRVLSEIAASDAPDSYLQSLHPKHEQFARLRLALLKARGKDTDGMPDDADAKPASDNDIKRIIINMERWRWLPERSRQRLCVEQLS